MNYGVILAGGRGERFWPLSTRKTPKQLLKLTSDKVMLEETVERITELVPQDRILIVTGTELKQKILDNTSSLKEQNLLLEPMGKNTCLALALAAVHIHKEDPDGVMIVLSSDHLIHPKEQLIRILDAAANLASRDEKLITIGIIPNRPETGYGYIEMGPKITEINGIKIYDVIQFKEKPERPKAQEYYLDRKHLWNSGMFVWSVKTFLNALKKHMPDMYACLEDYRDNMDSESDEPLKCLYEDCESISVDFAILEKAENVVCVKGDMRWDDVGSWLALQRIHSTHTDGNVALGDVIIDSSYENTIVNKGDDDEIIVAYGVTDLVIVKSEKVIMVAHKTKVNEIKELLAKLEKDEKYSKYL